MGSQLTSSNPITPAPMTIILSGTLDSERAPVDDTTFSSFISIPGKGVTSDPVAISIFLACIFSSVPSALSAVTSLGPVILP